MTDLDNTQIITDDESLLQNSSTIDTVREKKLFRKFSSISFYFLQEASLKIISGADLNTYQIGSMGFFLMNYIIQFFYRFFLIEETIIGRSNPSDLVISAPVFYF